MTVSKFLTNLDFIYMSFTDWFIKRQKMLSKSLVQGPGIQKTFRLSRKWLVDINKIYITYVYFIFSN